MTSARKIRANRANARASSGPKTAAGKAHSAQNAFRHGFNVPIWLDPALASDVDSERSAAEDSERYNGGDWWQLTDEEESIFVIDRERFPRMMTVWSCYEAFKNIAFSLSWDEGLLEQAGRQHPEWCNVGISGNEFSDFAKTFGGLTHREAHAFYAKHDSWCIRAGISQYPDGS